MKKEKSVLSNQQIYSDFLTNLEKIIDMRFSSEKSPLRIKSLKQLTKRVATLIKDNYLVNFEKSIIDFFFIDYDKNRKCFFELLESTYLDTNCRALKSAFDLIFDEILVFYDTEYWISSESNSSSKFDENLAPNERFVFCLNTIADLHSKTHGKKYGKVASVIADKINKCLSVNYLNRVKVEAWLIGRRSPIFVDTSVHHEISRRYKPYSILIAVEELSLAPKGYLTSVIKPMGVNEVNYVKHTQKIRSKKKAHKDSAFDLSLLPTLFREEAALYCEYKTSKFIDKKRNEAWVVREDERIDGSVNIFNATTINKMKIIKDGISVPSFSMFISYLVKIANFAASTGKLKADELTVFNLTQYKIVRDYFVDLDKNNISIHQHHKGMISTFSPMWNPEFCFFSEYSEVFCERYNISIDKLVTLSIENYENFKKLKDKVSSQVTQSPDSVKVKNRKILDLDSPIDYVNDALTKALEDVTIERQEKLFPYHKAILMRNICIINCLSHIPLRSRNWRDMRVGFHPNAECIFKDEKTNLYELSIPKHCFKNFNQLDIPDRFVYKFPKNVSLIIDDYINYARSVILGDDLISDYFLVTSKKIKLDANTFTSINQTFFTKYGNQDLKVGGIAVHFFRDIVATTFLKKFPSAYHHAALLLMDSEQTVKDNYGHLKHEDAFSLWNRHLSEEAV